MSLLKKIILAASAAYLLSGCASGQIKARKDQQNKIAQSSKLFCEFINGETYPDIDVAINLEMAKHCDSNKSMSMTAYRSPSEATGIVYCCSVKAEEKKPEAMKTEIKTDAGKPADLKKPEMKSDTKPEAKVDQKTEPKDETP